MYYPFSPKYNMQDTGGNGIDFIMDKASEMNKVTNAKDYLSDTRVGLRVEWFCTN